MNCSALRGFGRFGRIALQGVNRQDGVVAPRVPTPTALSARFEQRHQLGLQLSPLPIRLRKLVGELLALPTNLADLFGHGPNRPRAQSSGPPRHFQLARQASPICPRRAIRLSSEAFDLCRSHVLTSSQSIPGTPTTLPPPHHNRPRFLPRRDTQGAIRAMIVGCVSACRARTRKMDEGDAGCIGEEICRGPRPLRRNPKGAVFWRAGRSLGPERLLSHHSAYYVKISNFPLTRKNLVQYC